MKRLQDEAFVLGSQELGEADLIVTLLAQHHGKVRGVAPSARRSRRRFGGSLEPMTHVQATWVEKQGRDLHRIESLDSVRSYAAMQSDPLRQATCAVFAELSMAFAHEGQAEPRGFRLLAAVLAALQSGGNPWILVRYFEYWMLQLHGIAPDLTCCAYCSSVLRKRVAPRIEPGGGLVCGSCPESSSASFPRLELAALDLLIHFRGASPAQLPTASAAAQPGAGLDRLLRGTLEGFAERKFRTYRHLAALGGLEGDAC